MKTHWVPGGRITPAQHHGEDLAAAVNVLLQVLHPGAIGLIAKHHGKARGAEAIKAVEYAQRVQQRAQS